MRYFILFIGPAETVPFNSVSATEEVKSILQPTTENIQKVFEVGKPKDLKIELPPRVEEKTSSADVLSEAVEKASEVRAAVKSDAEHLKTQIQEKVQELQSSVKSTTEKLSDSVKSAADEVKEKAKEIKSSIDTSLTESSFSILGDDKEDKKELSTKDDNDIVVIGETSDKTGEIKEETLVPELGSLVQSAPSLTDEPQSLSAFELPSLQVEPESYGSSGQPQSLSTYEFPSLDHEKSKTDDGSDIEVLPTEEKSKPEKSASDTPAPSLIPKAKKDSKKTSSSEEVESSKDTKSKGRKGAKDIKRKEETDSKTKQADDTDGLSAQGDSQKKSKDADELEASSGKSKRKAKDAKSKPPPVPPKPKYIPESVHQTMKDFEVHIRHPTNSGEFISFGMKFKSQDSTVDHIITDVEEGGPASEVGLE